MEVIVQHAFCHSYYVMVLRFSVPGPAGYPAHPACGLPTGRSDRSKDQLRDDDLLCIIKEVQTVADQKTENVNIQVIDQLIDQAHQQRQVDVILIIILGTDSIEIADIDKQQGIKAKWPAIKKIQQDTSKQAVQKPRPFSINKAKGKGQD